MSSDVREFAAILAYTVTNVTYYWVARTRRHSIFVLMTRLAPRYLTDQTGKKNSYIDQTGKKFCFYIARETTRHKGVPSSAGSLDAP